MSLPYLSFADDSNFWFNLNYMSLKQYEDGERISSSENFYQNYYFQFNKPITPFLSSQFYLRANLINLHETTNSDSIKRYQREVEPAIDIFLQNPLYRLSTGYRRLENWSSANLTNENRKTKNYYYARLDITPYELPSLFLQYDKQKEYDYISPRKIDTTGDNFLASSNYNYSYKDLKLSYTASYKRSITETPLEILSKTINKNINFLYSGSYTKNLWSNKVTFLAMYQGNYYRNKTKIFSKESSVASEKRIPYRGLYVWDDSPETTDNMQIDNSLIDENFNTPTFTPINLSTKTYHNIGIDISFSQTVDTIRIYVNKDVRLDSNLTNVGNWQVYYTNSDPTVGSVNWSKLNISSVTVYYDPIQIFSYYEIKILLPQEARFFKVVNIATSNVSEVYVTEIEAYGPGFYNKGWATQVSDFLSHNINFNLNFNPVEKIFFSFNYFLTRSDQNPKSILGSTTGAFRNIFSNSVENNDTFKSNIMRNYGITGRWLAHKLLTISARYHRSDSFDNMKKSDFSSDNYSLEFSSIPLQTLNLKLSFNRTYNYSFDEKYSRSDSYFLTINSKLYKDVNMITDSGYIKSEGYTKETTSSDTKFLRGTIDARLTEKLYTNLIYNLNFISQENKKSTSHEEVLTVIYRPGNFLNFTGKFNIFKSGEESRISQGFFVDWLFLPRVRLNLGYEHQKIKDRTADTLNGYVFWNIGKSINWQITSSYTKEKAEKDRTNLYLGTNLTCTVW
ncbi:MAG: hypothetical protein QXL51_03035 [Candidatus Aenigmatarchaeota archaeon]